MKTLAFFLAATATATATTAAALWLRRKKTPAVSPLPHDLRAGCLGLSLLVPPPAEEIHGPSPVDLVCPSLELQEDGDLISEFMPANHEDKGEAVGLEGGEEHVPEDQHLRDHLDEDDDFNTDRPGVETEEEDNVGQGKGVRDVLHQEDGLVNGVEGFNGDGDCDEEQLVVIAAEGEGSLEDREAAVLDVPAEEDHERGFMFDHPSEVAVGIEVCLEFENTNQEESAHDDCNVFLLDVEAEVEKDVDQGEEVRDVLPEEDGLVEGVESGETADENKNHGEGGFYGDGECDVVQLVAIAEEGEGCLEDREADVLDVPAEEDNESDFIFDHLSEVAVGAEVCLEDENKNQVEGVHDDCNVDHLDVEAGVDEDDVGQAEEVRDVFPEEDGLVEGVKGGEICSVDENKNHEEGVQDGFHGDSECDVVQLVVIAKEGEGSLEDREADVLDVPSEDDLESAFMFDHLRVVAVGGEVSSEDENKNHGEGVQDGFHGDDECDAEQPVIIGNCETDVLDTLGEEEVAIGGEVCTVSVDETQGGFKEDNECVTHLAVVADGEEGENLDFSQDRKTEEKGVQDGSVDVHEQATIAHVSYVPDWKKRNPSLMEQIKALNMKARQIKAARNYTTGSMDHNNQHARMKEIAMRRAKELEEEEKERTLKKKARSLAKLEELNTRILTQSSHENHRFSSRLPVYPRRN